jgi:dolichol kinase
MVKPIKIIMVLVDKKILAGGIAMIVAGIIITFAYAEQPIGEAGMSEEEIIDLMVAEDQNQAYQMLSGILIGIGFLLVLISFGARRKKDSATRKEKKPAE